MDLFEEIVKMRRAGQRGALATIVHTNGSIPSYESSRMLVREDGSLVRRAASAGAAIVHGEHRIAIGRKQLAVEVEAIGILTIGPAVDVRDEGETRTGESEADEADENGDR